MSRNTLKSFRRDACIFCNLCSLDDLAMLFRIEKKELILQAFEPIYYHFTVPKSNGKQRQIEAPEVSLKKIQRQLNEYLQKVYYLHQSKAAYGYIPAVIGSMSQKNICTNAGQHLGCKYMMNADFEDFFHQVSLNSVKNIFSNPPFHFDKYSANTLAKICCFRERLPMGAPTSPVLSNFHVLKLDEELYSWACQNNVTYTRFVDDLTFSSKNVRLGMSHFNEINGIVLQHGLHFNSA